MKSWILSGQGEPPSDQKWVFIAPAKSYSYLRVRKIKIWVVNLLVGAFVEGRTCEDDPGSQLGNGWLPSVLMDNHWHVVVVLTAARDLRHPMV